MVIPTAIPSAVYGLKLAGGLSHEAAPSGGVILRVGVLFMASLDWSQCPAVESNPEKLGGAWVLRGTRMPVASIFENLEDGLTIAEVMVQFDVTREEIKAVLEFAARSLDRTPPHPFTPAAADARSL